MFAPRMSAMLLWAAAAAALPSTNVALPIPGRKQWDERDGYCGSCSIQQAALYYGNWLSQDVARKAVGNKELLPGVNEQKALTALHFTSDLWNGDNKPTKPAQFEQYMVWARGHLLQSRPVIITAYLSGGGDSDYDHIMPAIGVKTSHADAEYHADDTLVWNTNYQKDPVEHTFADCAGTRSSCKRGVSGGGCIPKKRDWGIAVLGVKDTGNETLPVQLSVDRWDEPHVDKGDKPAQLHGTATVSGLRSGAKYLLLRFDDKAAVPSKHFAEHAADATYAVNFTASGATFTYKDPHAIGSGGTAFYRAVQAPADF